MRFIPTELPGVMLIEVEPRRDSRGSFGRLYCPMEFAAAGLTEFEPAQINLSRNPTRHTLRGLHYQPAPHAETKLVRAVRGCAYDVVLDLRPTSPGFGRWVVVQLDAIAMNAVFVPKGCAHGFMTMQADTDILYLIGQCHIPDVTCGVRWDDPAFAIAWPAAPALVHPRDAGWPGWKGREPHEVCEKIPISF